MPKDFTVGKTAKVESVGIGAIFLRKINFVARNNVKEKNKHWREMDKHFFQIIFYPVSSHTKSY